LKVVLPFDLQMMHLVGVVQQYIGDRVVAASAWLEQVGCDGQKVAPPCRPHVMLACLRLKVVCSPAPWRGTAVAFQDGWTRSSHAVDFD
jgi:hypothetical protein